MATANFTGFQWGRQFSPLPCSIASSAGGREVLEQCLSWVKPCMRGDWAVLLWQVKPQVSLLCDKGLFLIYENFIDDVPGLYLSYASFFEVRLRILLFWDVAIPNTINQFELIDVYLQNTLSNNSRNHILFKNTWDIY